MDIDNELILKWEPKIQKLLTATFVVGMPITLEDTLKSSAEATEELEFKDLLEQSSSLSSAEKDFILLRLEGMNMDEISKDLQTSAYKIRDALREKIGDLLEEAKT